MKNSIISAIQNQLRVKPTIFNQFAKHIVLSKLEDMTRGLIQIIDEDEIYSFGNDQANPIMATITVRDSSFYSSLAFGGSVGVGEAYIRGSWDCNDLTSLVRVVLMNRGVLDRFDSGSNYFNALFNKLFHWLNKNTIDGSRNNIAAHYDIGNELFKLMLDKRMMYSSAVFPSSDSDLDAAATYKLECICQKLNLKDTDTLLEIGTGWGGFAIYAAKKYGCHVTTTTISKEQFNYANEQIQLEGLQDKITLLLDDYRDLEGQYDKLVSIEMIEAVGLDNMDVYFSQCSNLLKPGGLMCLQSITIEDQRYEQAKKEVDFIQKYIFPGGSLPSITAISNSITKSSSMMIYELEDIGLHYAKTIRHWRERFFKNELQVYKLGYSESFVRLWEFYLCYCEGGFAERSISTVHVVMRKSTY